MNRRVVITGMGIVTSLGSGVPATAAALRQGQPKIKKLASFDVSAHKTFYGGEVEDPVLDVAAASGVDTRRWDRASKLLYAASSQALKNAGVIASQEDPLRTAFVSGTTLGGMRASQAVHRSILTEADFTPRLGLMGDALACHQLAHVAGALNIVGETLILNNACASGLSAIGLAYERLRMGPEDMVIAGGYEVMSDFTHAGFNILQLVTSDACRPFDKGRTGLVLGEGAGVLVLETLENAQARKAPVLAEIIGYGQASDAYHLTRPDPAAGGASRAIRMAIEEAGILPEMIDYVNAHGTGTPSNDLMEAKALGIALGRHASKVPVSSTKPFMGHLLGASGAVETIISAIAIQEQMAPANLNLRDLDPECALNVITGEVRALKVNVVLSNSFGFGGSNAAILLKRFGG
ncbi:MAG: beta-ketoacyl-[acyl-carrier-protein] synthase family protein [Candidatus Omnitrophica bacterium]|nr:beta-ketoacyl-[acyl-carrier-protein] synthase family protein [Candidatus Omnitrophota bacterium]